MATNNTPAPSDNLVALLFRVSNLEQIVKDLHQQMREYVRTKENDLQLQNIEGTVGRIEREVIDAKKQIVDVNNKLITQDATQRESQDKLQIRVLWGIVSAVGAILVAVLIAFLTHHLV